jgi:hypothetical protein
MGNSVMSKVDNGVVEADGNANFSAATLRPGISSKLGLLALNLSILFESWDQ